MAFLRLLNQMDGNLYKPQYGHGAGNDTVRVGDNFNYTIQTLGGDDQIWLNTVVSSTATNRIYCGAGADLVVGSNFAAEVVFDGADADVILTAGGNDTVHVGSGDDYYAGGAGTDTLSFWWQNLDAADWALPNSQGVVVDLAITTGQFFGLSRGTDIIVDFENVDGTVSADRIKGSSAANMLNGHHGNDQLFGRGGNDFLYAGAGSDQVTGEEGADQLFLADRSFAQNSGRDFAIYSDISHSGPAASNRDTIFDFDRDGALTDDVIDLRGLDGNSLQSLDQALIWRGTVAAFGTDTRGELRIQDLGADIMVWIDTDADAAAEMSILVKAVDTMDVSDFLL